MASFKARFSFLALAAVFIWKIFLLPGTYSMTPSRNTNVTIKRAQNCCKGPNCEQSISCYSKPKDDCLTAGTCTSQPDCCEEYVCFPFGEESFCTGCRFETQDCDPNKMNWCCNELICVGKTEEDATCQNCRTEGTMCDVDVKSCCDGLQCVNEECKKKCVYGELCETDADCCSTMSCTTTKTASFCGECGKAEASCENNSGVDTCCDGYKCASDGTSLTCQRQCALGDPCKTDKDCCLKLICGLDSLGLSLVCLDPLLGSRNDTIS